MSLPYPHTASPEESPQRRPLYAQTHPNKHSHVSREAFSLSLSLSAFFSFFLLPPSPTTPHARSIFFLQTTVSDVFVFHYNTTRKRDERERKRRREERCSKSQEGGIYVDVGEIHHPPSLHWIFFFFFITEGKQGPPQSLPHHHKYGCWEECAGEA